MKSMTLKFGLVTGLEALAANIAMNLIYFIIGVDTQSFLLSILTNVVTLAVLIVCILNYRRKLGGFMTFSQCWNMLIVAAVVMAIGGYIYSYVYMNYLDKDFVETAVSASVQTMSSMGAPVDSTVEAMMRENLENSMKITPMNVLMGLGAPFVMYVVGGAIFSYIFAKKDPNQIEE